MSKPAEFTNQGGETVAFKSIHFDGRLEGLVLRMNMRQSYRNETDHPLETVYTFPLPWRATLTGMIVEIAGKKLHGQVFPKAVAQEQYENAIASGHTPVMVELSAAGLYTANLGKLGPGEEAIIEIQYTQLLRFEHAQVRICVPTVLAPRFGHAQASGGLAPHETADVDPLAVYGCSLKLDVIGPVSRAKISCPSHAVVTAAIDNGLSLHLEKGGMLDRDIIFKLEGIEGQSFAVVAPAADHQVIQASFCPEIPSGSAQPLLVKILVDCSGSMQGDSIRSTRQALETAHFSQAGPLFHVMSVQHFINARATF